MRITQLVFAAILLAFITALFSCKTADISVRGENFDTFYQRFHTDSAFQISRLKFPLDGLKVDETGEHNWNVNNWNVLTIPVFEVDTTEFNVFFELKDKTFTQKAWIDNSGFSIEYRFDLLKKKWYLVYAMEVNL
jgi:hypothetical protein